MEIPDSSTGAIKDDSLTPSDFRSFAQLQGVCSRRYLVCSAIVNKLLRAIPVGRL
jgi:hypothetical protein